MTHPDSSKNFNLIIQISSFLAGSCTLVFMFAFAHLYPELPQTIWDRYLLALGCFIAMFLSFSPLVQKHYMDYVLLGVTFMLSIDFAWILYTLEFHAYYLSLYFIVVFASFANFRIPSHSRLYLIISTLGFGIALFATSAVSVGNVWTVGLCGMLSLFLGFFYNHIRIVEHAELKKRESDLAMFRIAFDSTQEGIGIADLNGTCIYQNRAMTDLTGYTAMDLNNGAKCHLYNNDNFEEEMKSLMKKGESLEKELILNSKSGEQLDVEVRIGPVISEQGELLGIMGMHRDIRARKKTEQTLRKMKEAAEAAAIAKSEFLANMSHEIRTPMNAVIGMASLMLETNLSKEQKEFAEIIRNSGDNLLTIINDILDFSKIDSGKMELEEQPFLLSECLKNVMDLLKVKAKTKKLELGFEIAPNVPAGICSDPTRLTQILVNLTNNAIKFTHEGGVHIKVNRLDQDQNQCHIQFEIQDSGIGIPPEKIDRLFQSFSQVDASTTRKYGGTGLGLAISKKLSELLGGDIWVKSDPGKGSSFFFTIQAEIAEILADSAAETQDAQSKNVTLPELRILLVEDNLVNQKVALKMLQKIGQAADVAGNGQEGVTAFELKHYDLVLMDMQMPVMDGLEATRQIRLNLQHQTEQPIIVALTANAMKGDRERCLEAGMDDYLSKPLKLSEIHEMMKKWFLSETAIG